MPAVVTREPIFKPEISFEIDEAVSEERATIVHCTVIFDSIIRIWKTTYLIQNDGSRKQLLYAYHIPEYPNWALVTGGHVFTLVFEGLDKGCVLFDLLEDIPQPGGFHIEGIRRNKQDVYKVDVW
jgi:hypothetical protein